MKNSRPDKYNPYTSQPPTDGDPNSRSYKRRQWRNAWRSKFLAKPGKMNFERKQRRYIWHVYWGKFVTVSE